VSTFAECVILRSHLPSGVNIDLDLRAIAANRNPDRARSDSHFPILEPKADLAGAVEVTCQLPVFSSLW